MTTRCTACTQEVPDEPAVADVCPHCRRFVYAAGLARYCDVELIGRGGMGAVYRARDEGLGTTVAIKVVRAGDGPDGLFERFQREARLAARISHPGVVRVYATDRGEGRLFLVMEHVEGMTLRAWMQQGPLDVPWCIDKTVQLCEVLHAAHAAGIVHRDVKPENVLVDTTGRVRVLDFGISRLTESEEKLTRTGEILGTPEYLAPEQILDEPQAVDARADVYATGVVLYEMLTGVSPFAGPNLFQVLKLVESRIPSPPSTLRSDLPPGLDDVVMAAIAKDKRERPSDSLAFAKSLRRFGARPVAVPSRSGAALAGLFVVVGFLAGLLWNVAFGSAEPERKSEPARPTAAEELRALLAEPDALTRWQLADAILAVPDSAAPEDLFQRGLARKYSGQFVAARRDLETAKGAGVADAGDHLAALWHYENTLLGVLSKSMNHWFARAPEAGGESDWQQAMALLARGDGAAAFAKLESWKAPAALSFDRTALLALTAALAGKRDVADKVVATPSDYTPLALIRAWLRKDDAELRDAIARIDRQAATRYLLEAALAASHSDIPRLRASSELALVAGAEREATMFYAGARLDLADAGRASIGLPADEASRLVHVLARRHMPEYPKLDAVRFLLALFARDAEAAKRALENLPDTLVPVVRETVTESEKLASALSSLPGLDEPAKKRGLKDTP